MLIETALMTWLLAQSGITDLISTRIYLGMAPQRVTAPYLVVSKISGVRSQSNETTDHLAHPRFQFTCFAASYAAAKGVVAALQAVLQGYRGTMGGAGGVAVGAAIYEDETDLAFDESEGGLYGVAADYIIWHYE